MFKQLINLPYHNTDGDGDTLAFLMDSDTGDENKELVLDETPESEESTDTSEVTSDDDANLSEEEKTAKAKETKEVDPLAELEEELEPVSEDKLELVTPVRRAEILKQFPELFKKFPYLEKAYYRDLAFTELLPTIDDAKEAVQAVQTLNRFEEDLKNGDLNGVLNAVLKEDKEAFNQTVDNYLPTLAKISPDAHLHVIGSVIKDTIVAMVMEAKESGNDVLSNAAAILNQYAFGTTKLTAQQPLSTKKVDNPDKTKLDTEKKEFNDSRLTTYKTETMTGVDNRIKSVSEAALTKGVKMTDFIKEAAMNKIDNKLKELVSKDTRFQTIVGKLWDAAAKNGYKKDDLDKIKGAHFSKAKTLLPAIIQSARNEALKGMGKRVTVKSEETNNEENTETKPRESTPRTNSGNNIDKNKPQPGESSYDYMTRVGK